MWGCLGINAAVGYDKILLFFVVDVDVVILFVYFLLIIHTPTRSSTPLSPPRCVKRWITAINKINKSHSG